jgi:hypothetical protein
MPKLYNKRGKPVISFGLDNYKMFTQLYIPTAAGVLYTNSPFRVIIVKRMSVVNNTAATITFQLFQNGTSNDKAITPVVTLGANSMAEYEGTVVLNPGDTVQGSCSTGSAVAFAMYGIDKDVDAYQFT